MSVFAHLVEQLADLLQPFFHASATAAAIVLFTALVRLATHPLARAAARGQRARTALQPRITELRAKHARDPERLQRAVLELHTEAKVSPFSGLLPGLLQLPAFFLLYHLFSNATIGDGRNTLLDHDLLAAPLAGRWADALGGGIFGGPDLVYLALFAVVAAVATVNFRRARRAAAENPVQAGDVPGQAAVGKVAPFLSFLTLVTVAVVPLAAALYVVTSTTWSAVERAMLS
ncbi:membrane protein insertase YidC [Streptomyces griseoluteus]|uniref:Membrane protein insertase YidC n=1 Tax=Streptomyces griseoluteus TaxID=29306 RepID=A0A4Z1D6P1_STRGP|nr:membrane protein insertase YidC [Streptomyces griseoluteus]TGN77439.1 membrane protein insertase YidC [Streptomyces griseoluteus]GHF25452.1 membrane protein [Streptomyces griseoluteus]